MNIRPLQRHLTILALVTLCSFGFASVAQADNLAIGDGRFLGSIDPGTPASEVSEAGFINHLIDLAPGTLDNVFDGNTYDRSAVACAACPDATAAGALRTNTSEGDIATLGSGWQYLLAKYGNTSYVWNVAGLTGTGHSIPDTLGPGGGLSHTTAFQPNQHARSGTQFAPAAWLRYHSHRSGATVVPRIS